MKSTFTILSTIFFLLAATLTIIALLAAVVDFTVAALPSSLTMLLCSIMSLLMILIAAYHLYRMFIKKDEDAVSFVSWLSFCAISLVCIAFTLL